jgi:hypothetical protein
VQDELPDHHRSSQYQEDSDGPNSQRPLPFILEPFSSLIPSGSIRAR